MELVDKVFSRLSKIYKARVWWTGMSPTDLLVATILSQNTTDKNSTRAYKSLKDNFTSWEQLLKADEKRIAKVIHHGGLPNIKAKRIKTTLKEIKRRKGTTDISFLKDIEKEEAQEFLESLHGIGPKTAAVVLALSFNKEIIPVDTHVHRVANRVGITREKTPAKTQEKLETVVPNETKRDMHHMLIEHGRQVCKAQNPKCSVCILNDLCEFYTLISHQR
jgi:endonuclease-3